jgi:5'-3' exonuclease
VSQAQPVPAAASQAARLLLIDGHYLLHRTLRVQEFAALTDAKGRCTGGIVGVTRMVASILAAYPSLHRVVYVWDAGISKRRKALYPEYKAHRTSQKPKSEKTEEELKYQADFAFNQRYLTFLLTKLGCKVAACPGKEGDDTIAYVARQYATPCIVLSEDKDLYQLVNPWCHVYRPSSGNYVTPENFEETAVLAKDSKKNPICVPRHTYILARAILGDESDGIAGINGTGPVSVKEIMANVPNVEDSMEMLKAMVAYCQRSKSKKIAQVGTEAAFAILGRNIQLMDLHAEEFGEAEVAYLRRAIDTVPVLDLPKIQELCNAIQAKSMLIDIGVWAAPFQRLQ